MNSLKILSLVSVALLSGCAAQVVASNERTVIVKAEWQDASPAMKLSEAECSKFNRHAQLKVHNEDTRQWIFDCVP